MSPQTDKRLDTIAKLLAKAESTNFPAEAEALTEQAERMMVRYGIDKAAVDAERGVRGQTQEKIIEDSMMFTGVNRKVMVEGCGQVLNALQLVTTLQSGSMTRPQVWLYAIGTESDVAAMLRLAGSLQVQAEHALLAWWKTHEVPTWYSQYDRRTERRTYLEGWFRGATARAHQSVRDAIKDRDAETGTTGTELVLANRQQRAQEKVAELYPNIKSAKEYRRKHGSMEAAAAGRRDGAKANVNGKELAGRGAITAS